MSAFANDKIAGGATDSISSLKLVPLSGPPIKALTLDSASRSSYTIGRRSGHDLHLSDPASRDHALITAEAASDNVQWCLTDTNSKHGTKLNGIALAPGQPYPIKHGDLIHIAIWTLRVHDAAAHTQGSTVVRTVDDKAAVDTSIHDIKEGDLVHQRLGLLMRCAEAIHKAEDEQTLARAVIDALVVGTGFPNAALLRMTGDEESIEVVGASGAILDGESKPQISRSLLRRASSGRACRLARDIDLGSQQQSIMQYGIDEALCVPVILSGAPASYIYLDGRGESAHDARRTVDAADFAICIAQLTSMSLANLMRLDLERRKAKLDAELTATGEAQRLLLPLRSFSAGTLQFTGESRPGRVVSGDFFDVIPLDNDRAVVALGDVVGKGITASVLMTAALSFLRAAMIRTDHPGKALEELNTFLHPRCVAGRFITLWAGLVDAARNTLTYTDAGHGYAFLYTAGEARQLNKGEALPIGVVPKGRFESQTIEFEPGSRLLVLSDGIVEQPIANSGRHELFGVESVHRAVADLPHQADVVKALFAAVEAKAATTQLDDDATVLLVRHAGQ